MPPTVLQISGEVADNCGRLLDGAGLFLLRDGEEVVAAIRRGIRRGLHAVGVATADPADVSDADVANLSGFALERVVQEAELYALGLARADWWRAAQAEQPALEAQPMAGGWRAEQRSSLRARTEELRDACSRPYREPADPIVVVPGGADWGPPPGWGSPGWYC